MIVLMLAAFAAIYLIEIPRLKKRKLKREMTAFIILMTMAVALSVLYYYDAPIPHPVKDTQYYFKALAEHVFGMSYD